jgi:CMP-N-acetylneuraminic acid synthetase
MDSIVLIPARSGSKGIKNKNLMEVKGESLVIRTLNHAECLDHKQIKICVSSDSFGILKICADELDISINKKDFVNGIIYINNKYIFHLRPKFLSKDNSLISELLRYLYKELIGLGISPSVWLLLQPTTPYRSKKELVKIKKILLSNQNSEKASMVSVKKVEENHPARMYSLNNGKLIYQKEYEKFYFSRRQDLPEIFIRDGGFYIIGSELVRQGFQYSTSPMALIRHHPWNLNIDTPEDLIIAQNVLIESLKDDPVQEKC